MATDDGVGFDVEQFFAAIDAARTGRGLSWRDVARSVGVSASTLTRLRQGSRPDVETFFRLCSWAGVNPDSFRGSESVDERPASLPAISALLRSDPNLSADDVSLLETVLFSAYEKLTRPET